VELSAAKLLPEPGPQRALALATFVNGLGSGMFMTSSVLYATRIVGLPTDQVAVGLFAGAAVGLVAGVLGGRAADRWGARESQIAVMLSGAVVTACFLLVRSFWPYLVVSVLLGLVFAADKASRAPLVRGLGGDRPTAYRAYLRSVTNLALAFGALAAGAGIELNTDAAYLVLIGGRAVAFLGCALVTTRVRHLPPVPTPPGAGRWAALRDRPYLTATVLNCLMSLHFAVPTFLLPLWIVDHTSAPRWMVSGALLLNTLMVIVLQVRVSATVRDPESAGRGMRLAGAALLLGLALMAAASGPSGVVATALLLGSMALYTLGELWHSAASMEWSFGLAPSHAQGQYAGVFGIGAGMADAVSPAVVGALALTWGKPGFVVLGLVFLAVGALSSPLIAWSRRPSLSSPSPVQHTQRGMSRS
jgi:MFS family permease